MDELKKIFHVFKTFLKIGAFTFGGGLAMLPLIEEEVIKNGWVEEKDIVDVLAIAQSVPGAIAVNSAIFIGYKIGRLKYALVATLGIVLPSFLIILAVANLLLMIKDHPFVEKAFIGVRAGVTSMIFLAAFKLGKAILKDWMSWCLALISFVSVAIFKFHPIIILLTGAVVGILYYKILRDSWVTKIAKEQLK